MSNHVRQSSNNTKTYHPEPIGATYACEEYAGQDYEEQDGEEEYSLGNGFTEDGTVYHTSGINTTEDNSGPAPVVHIPAETVKILETVKPGSAPNKESAAGQAAWQCTLCKRMFSSKKYIVSHMKEDHHVTKEKAIDLS